MLLFLIDIEPLTQKILFSTKIQGISLGSTSLKVSHYADDLTFFISSPDSFAPIRKIIEEFSHYSGLRINQSKTTIIYNSPELLSTYRSTFPQGKVFTSSKILGINFSFQNQDLSKNWDELIRSLPYSTLSTLNLKDSLFFKVIFINQHFLLKILFLSRIILPTPKQIKSLTSLLFKFLWNYSPFKPIKRSTLYLPKSNGGIALPSIVIKISTAYQWKLIIILQSPSSQKHFWMKYGIYNLETKIIPIKPELFSNSQPHRPKPNQLWIKTLNLFQKNPIPLEHLNKLTFKSLYQILLNPDSNPLPITNTNISHTWPRLTLCKPCPSLFSNLEKEIAFKTAYKGFTWGSFFHKDKITPRNPNDLSCKLCSSSLDDPDHLFFDCPHTVKLTSALEPLFSETLKTHFTFTKDILLHNYTNTTGTPYILISKLASLIRLSLFQIRNNIPHYTSAIPPSLLNEELYKIKTKFKIFLQKINPDDKIE